MDMLNRRPRGNYPQDQVISRPVDMNSVTIPAHRGNVAVEKNVSPLVRQFLDYLKLERHFSDYTVKSYGADLIQFGQFLSGVIGPNSASGNAANLPGDELDQKQVKCEPLTIREFLAYLYG